MSIRVLLVDDHLLFRQALHMMLESEPDIDVVGELGDGALVEEAVVRLMPDIVLMDIGMPGINGVDATRDLLAKHPLQRVLGLSAYNSETLVAELLQLGAWGYVLKSSSGDDLVCAIRAVAGGSVYCSQALTGFPDNGPAGLPRARAPALLSEREKEVLGLLAGGSSSPEIALALNLAASTVDVHRRNIMGKLGLHSVAELTQYAVRTGMISI